MKETYRGQQSRDEVERNVKLRYEPMWAKAVDWRQEYICANAFVLMLTFDMKSSQVWPLIVIIY